MSWPVSDIERLPGCWSLVAIWVAAVYVVTCRMQLSLPGPRLPGMNGIQFLSKGKKKSPDSVRMMLTKRC